MKKLTYQEKRTFLQANPKLKKMWYTVLVLLIISVIFRTIFFATSYQDAGTSILITIISISIIFGAVIIYGVYKLKDWVMVFFWIWFLSALGTKDIISIIITGIILWFYFYIIRKINAYSNSMLPENKIIK